MSGHSKWTQIKHKKALTDAQKSKEFAKLARQITLAAKEKGPDPAMNPALRTAVDKAKASNMPSGNIERAIKRAESKENALEAVLFEAYGPGGAAILINGITDNKNRTAQEIKHLLLSHNAKLASPGSAKFLFTKTVDGWQAQATIKVGYEDKKNLEKLFEELGERDDVNGACTNADIG